MADDHDRRLASHVRPPGWENPRPKARYDLVVIGGGTAGLVCAAGAAGLGARVALVESSRLGGDCLNSGCVPSKALLRSARAAGEARGGAALGVAADARVDFAAVMSRLRARRADIAPNDSAARLASLGVDVFFGHGEFADPQTVTVDAVHLPFRRAVIATGSRPAVPPIPGLDTAAHLTNETIFDLTEQPRRLIVLGGGPVGCELAQAFARLGTRVTLVESGPRLLPREDADAAAVVARAFAADGIDVRTDLRIDRVSTAVGGLHLDGAGTALTGDALLVATGRAVNVEQLGLDAAGVEANSGGIQVDERMRTTNPRIYASGDVASRFKFTHAADALSRIVIQNALFFGRKRADALVIPWCTFTQPEVAHVGLASEQAAATGASTITVPLSDVDRAVVDDERDGFVRLHHQGSRIVGATIVGPSAGETISLVAYAMRHGRSPGDFSSVVFPYPTIGLALRQAGDAYRRASLTPGVRRALGYYFRALGAR